MRAGATLVRGGGSGVHERPRRAWRTGGAAAPAVVSSPARSAAHVGQPARSLGAAVNRFGVGMLGEGWAMGVGVLESEDAWGTRKGTRTESRGGMRGAVELGRGSGRVGGRDGDARRRSGKMCSYLY